MYKYSNAEHTAVTNGTTGASGIHPGVWQYEAYREWKNAGGITEAFDTRTPAEIAAAELVKVAAEQRVDAIGVAQEAAGLKEVTVTQALTWLDNLFASADTTAKKFAAIETALKKIVPYLLK